MGRTASAGDGDGSAPARAEVSVAGAGRGPQGRARRRISAEILWARQRLRETKDRHTVIPRTPTPTRTPDRSARVRVRHDVRASMRDGVRLSADVYEPATTAGPWPAILIRMPYGKNAHYFMPARGTYWARKGYACVIQDVRGRGGSQGRWDPLVNEARDGYDTLDWLAAQPWCDGRIGMAGESYHGMTQWAVAPLGHPHLRAIAPGNTSTDLYEFVHPGGAFMHTSAGLWAWEMCSRRNRNPHRFDPWHLPLLTTDEAAGAISASYREYVEHWRRDAYWDRARLAADLSRVDIPVFHWGGWHDVLLNGTLATWGRAERCRPHGRPPQRQWLTIAGTDHALGPTMTGRIGRLPAGEHVWSFDRVQRFMDRWVREDHNGQEDDPRVQMYVVGADEWRAAAAWPLPTARPTTLYLHSRGGASGAGGSGVLDAERPGDEPADEYRYDPADPVDWWLGASLWAAADHLGDRRSLERRRDVLLYTTPPLDDPLEVVGPLSARLYVTSSCPDTDFTAALVDVFPDGYAQLVQEGICRARFRQSTRREELLTPGQIAEVDVDMWAAGHRFARGHNLRLEVSSSGFGRWDRNLNSGHILGEDAQTAAAVNQVFHDHRYPSSLHLYVTEPSQPARPAGGATASPEAAT